jgi:hypothetical protein
MKNRDLDYADDDSREGSRGWLESYMCVEFKKDGKIIGTVLKKEFEDSGETPNLILTEAVAYWNKKEQNIIDGVTARIILVTDYGDGIN